MEAFLNLFEEIEEIKTGFSNDRLFKCVDEYGNNHLCRFFALKQMARASEQYEVLKQFKGQPHFQQVEYILKCQDNLHGVLVYDWVEGIPLRDYLKEHPEQQFELGQQAGQLLKQLHDLKIPHQFPIGYQTNRLKKFENQLTKYLEMGGEFVGMDELITKFEQNKSKYHVEQLIQCHGDFHSGNMIIDQNNHLTLIDFGSSHTGDVSDDLAPLIFFDEIEFIKGVLDSYQPSKQSMVNTKIMLYSSPRSVLWAMDHGLEQVDFMIKLNQQLLDKLSQL